MSKVSIKYLWWIEDENYWSSLTWSATLMKVKFPINTKILFDYWMFQWWKNENTLNLKTDDEAIKADFIVITHAHTDHIWRLPLLVKKWFKWKIVMTNITKQLMQVMLSDYVKLTKDKIDSLKKDNKNKWLKLRTFLKFIKLEEDLRKNNLDKKQKEKKQKDYNSIVWQNNPKTFLSEVKQYLKKVNVENEEDIEQALNSDIPTLLYDTDDIYSTMSLIETLDIWNEIDLDNNIVITKEDSEVIDKIPEIVRNWYNRPIFVTSYLRLFIIKRFESKIKEVYDDSKNNKDLRVKLDLAFKIFNKSKKIEDQKVFSSIFEAENLLREYNISSKQDIEKLKDNIIKLPFTKDELNNIKSLLKVYFNKPNEKIIESFKLRFIDAWHVEWSIQAIVTMVTKTLEKKYHWINNLQCLVKENWYSRIRKEHKNFLFTWDLWKITDPNLSWVPEKSNYKFDYVQCESTYATRNHPDKQKEFSRFIDEISSTKAKVLIPAFSLQRTQEIIVELLEANYNNLDKIAKLRKIQKERKKQDSRYKILLQKKENLSEKEQLEKDKLFSYLSESSNIIDELSRQNPDFSIILDSPLWSRISDIFLENIWEKYKFLDPNVQKELFWNEKVRKLEKWEYKNLYTGKRKKAKDIILSSGWMLQWWAIINHLKEILGDPDSKIIFTWYQSLWTIWNKILAWDKQVIIEGEIYDVKCSVVQVRWFSSHIWSDDIETYLKELNYSKKPTITLNHWWDNRIWLSKIIKKTKSWVKVIVPKLYDEVKIRL